MFFQRRRTTRPYHCIASGSFSRDRFTLSQPQCQDAVFDPNASSCFREINLPSFAHQARTFSSNFPPGLGFGQNEPRCRICQNHCPCFSAKKSTHKERPKIFVFFFFVFLAFTYRIKFGAKRPDSEKANLYFLSFL